MSPHRASAGGGFTLIEVMTALLILSLLSLMSYRGLSAVLDTRDHVNQETEKWRAIEKLFGRFADDVRLAAPRAVRRGDALIPAWSGNGDSGSDQPLLEFSRFASHPGVDSIRRVAYQLNDRHEIELLLRPGLDQVSDVIPSRYTLLRGVDKMEIEYLDRDLVWAKRWPGAAQADKVDAIPRAVRIRIVLTSGEELIRIFALNT